MTETPTGADKSPTGARPMRVIVLGVHVLDVLARPIEAIPDGQGGQLVEEIRACAAGTAGGTAVTLAKLGAQVQSAGAIGTDALGDLLLMMLAGHDIDTSLLIRRDTVQTSASVLPIRPDGSRPAFHVVGANATYSSADAPYEQIAQATHLHLGGPEFMGGAEAAKILRFAREHGVTTSADLLAPGEQASAIYEWIAPAFPYLDYLLPNDEQVLGLTQAPDLEQGCARLLHTGIGCVAATAGADGALIVSRDATDPIRVPAFETDVVDTSGCGDAFSAGFLRGIALGRDHARGAQLGCAAASLVAQGLGSDHGAFDLAAADDFARDTPAIGTTERA